MNYSLIVTTVILELIIICGVSWVLKVRSKMNTGEDFITSGRNLPTIAIAATQALTALGGGHILGLPIASWQYGVAAYWYIIGSGLMLVIMLNFTGPWIRRFGFTTINQLFEKMFDMKTSIVMAGIAAGTVWGILTLETQGVGAVIAGMTGWSMIAGCVVGGCIGILYVIFGGMKEIGWVNVFNSVFMYVGALIAVFYLGTKLPNGWQGVNDFHISNGNEWALSIWANSDTWRTYIIGTITANLFYVAIGPQAAQVSASAKNVKAIRNAVFYAVPLNCIFGAIMIAFGMASQTIPEYAEAGPVMGTFGMLINLLPGWLVAWLLAAFSAAMLSTIAVQVLTLATIFVKDIYVRYYNPNATDRQQSRYVRYAILFFAIGGIILSTALPPVNSAIVWLFSWLLPAFWMFVFGMFWKRSSRAAFYTLIISGVANTIWSFSSLPAYFNLEGNNNSIVMVVFSFTLGIILTAGDKNAKPGMVKMYLENKHEVVAPGRTGVLVEE